MDMLAHQGSFTLILVYLFYWLLFVESANAVIRQQNQSAVFFRKIFFQKWDIINLIIVLLD